MARRVDPDRVRAWGRLVARGALTGSRLIGRGTRGGLDRVRQRTRYEPESFGTGLVLVGTVWTGGSSTPAPGAVVLDDAGTVVDLLTGDEAHLDAVLDDAVPRLGGAGCWIGPGLEDAHVRVGQRRDDGPGAGGGVFAARDLASGLAVARRRRTTRGPEARGHDSQTLAMSGPLLVYGVPAADDEYRDTVALDGPARARSVVHRLAADGADVISLDLDPGPDGRSLDPATVRAVVDTAHASGLAVVARALGPRQVGRALDCGVDELARVPVEPLSEAVATRMARSGLVVVSTVQAFFSAGLGRDAARNASLLVEAGVRLRYGTLGDGAYVDPRELDRLADTGLGRLGALRTAVVAGGVGSSAPPGPNPGLQRGRPAGLVVLAGDPLVDPLAWRAPLRVVAVGRTLTTLPPADPALWARKENPPTPCRSDFRR